MRLQGGRAKMEREMRENNHVQIGRWDGVAGPHQRDPQKERGSKGACARDRTNPVARKATAAIRAAVAVGCDDDGGGAGGATSMVGPQRPTGSTPRLANAD